ncbi:MAG: stage V sporulation protein AA [Eubacterium ramulus]
MSAAGQILYLKIEQNCIVYKRSVTLQDIASVECTDVGILQSGVAGTGILFFRE